MAMASYGVPSYYVVGKHNMRGLIGFVANLRNAKSKEKEDKRVNQEMAKIRRKFLEGKEIDGHNRRKYISKLLYMFMMGYEINFGYMEAINLLSSNKLQEKLMGHLAIGLLLHESHEMVPLVINSFSQDLQSREEMHQSLALSSIANIGGKEMAESLAPMVQKLLTSKSTKALIKKKASLTLLRLFRKYPELITPDQWSEKLASLLEERDHGVLISLMSLLLGVIAEDPKGYENCVPKVINVLHKIVIEKVYPKDYVFYHIPSPWLQVKLLRFLKNYPAPEDRETERKIFNVLKKILDNAESVSQSASNNHRNALYSILVEAIDIIVQYDNDRDLITKSTNLLGKFVSMKEANLRYLGLSGMSRIATVDNEKATMVRRYQETVVSSLQDPDISIRKRALDLLYGMCDSSNSKVIVSELLEYLSRADHNISFREELVLKIAILAEKFAVSYAWYVDVILQLIALAGDFVSDDIWYRVVQIVTNNENIQEYAAETVLKALKQPHCHETAVKVGGYILGEFGELIAEKPQCSPRQQFEAIHKHFATCSLSTKALMLSTYVKFVNLYPDMKTIAQQIFQQHNTSIDAELQQRACEYLQLTNGSPELLQTVWEMMPAFSNKNTLINSEVTPDASSPPPEPRQEQPPPPATSSSSIMDLLGTEQPSSPSQSPFDPVSSATTSQSPFDLEPQEQTFSPFDFDSSNGSAQQAKQPAKRLDQSMSKLVLAPQGVLYEDQNIQIGFKSEYKGNVGRMMLFYGNCTNEPFTNISIDVSSPNGLKINPQSAATKIDPKAQISQHVSISCEEITSDVPFLNVSFVKGGKLQSINAPLPVVFCKFIEPTKMTGPIFFQKWSKYKETEQQSVIRSSKQVDMAWLQKLIGIGFNLSILQGVDPNTNNLVASGTFRSATEEYEMLLRIETNPTASMYRTTVRSTSPPLTVACKDLLENQLK